MQRSENQAAYVASIKRPREAAGKLEIDHLRETVEFCICDALTYYLEFVCF